MSTFEDTSDLDVESDSDGRSRDEEDEASRYLSGEEDANDNHSTCNGGGFKSGSSSQSDLSDDSLSPLTPSSSSPCLLPALRHQELEMDYDRIENTIRQLKTRTKQYSRLLPPNPTTYDRQGRLKIEQIIRDIADEILKLERERMETGRLLARARSRASPITPSPRNEYFKIAPLISPSILSPSLEVVSSWPTVATA